MHCVMCEATQEVGHSSQYVRITLNKSHPNRTQNISDYSILTKTQPGFLILKYRFSIQFLLVFFPKFNNVYLPDKGDYHPHKLSDKI